MITATINKNWRDECFGELDFDKLEYFLMMAYHVCKDIDSTEWFEHWPAEIRKHIATAYNCVHRWNEINAIKENNPHESDADFAFKSYINRIDAAKSGVRFAPVYGCLVEANHD